MITISENAKIYLEKIYLDNPDKIIKIGVKSGGCSGLTYSIDLISPQEIESDDEIITNPVKIVIDGLSIMFLIGTNLDYETDVMGSRLVFKNPNKASSCGCEKSFSV